MNINLPIKKLKKFGLMLWLGGWRDLWPTLRTYLPYIGRIKNYRIYYDRLREKSGLEIGGPSKILRRGNILPIYPVIGALDGCNYAAKTVWEGEIAAGEGHYRYDEGKPAGWQYICDAVALREIPDKKYDFVVSSHCLEHIANPLKALREWIRVIKPGGVLLLVLPDKRKNFDRLRPITTFTHLMEDLRNNIAETDLAHIDEFRALHDKKLDPKFEDPGDLRSWEARQLKDRILHHHVFDKELLREMFRFLELEILSVDYAEPGHIIMLGGKA